MKVNLIKETPTIKNYIGANANSKKYFSAWVFRIRTANWEETSDIKQTFSTADFLGNGTDRIVPDIGGNNYRIICQYWFGKKKVHLYIKWMGTHAEYDKLCAKNEQYTVCLY